MRVMCHMSVTCVLALVVLQWKPSTAAPSAYARSDHKYVFKLVCADTGLSYEHNCRLRLLRLRQYIHRCEVIADHRRS
jgi:hypothetical protein